MNTDEVDKATLDVNAHELDRKPISDVQMVPARHKHALNRRMQCADPGTFITRAGYQRIDAVADPIGQERRGSRFADLPLNLVRSIFLLGAVGGCQLAAQGCGEWRRRGEIFVGPMLPRWLGSPEER